MIPAGKKGLIIHSSRHNDVIKDIRGKTCFWIGSNYWPGHSGLQMWTNWQPEKIELELKKMIDLGFNVNRSFLFMPDFIPDGKRVEPVMLNRLNEFLKLCEDINIGTILSFFVGHMSGEDWEVPWRKGRNFYSDNDLRKIQKIYVESVVESCCESKAVVGWIISNEISNYEPNGASGEIFEWVEFMNNCIRKYDQIHPISLGDGCWSPEVNRRLKNFKLRKLSKIQDFLGLHFYPRSGNPWHQSFTSAFRLQLAQYWGSPLIIEEFGQSTTMSSELNQAHYFRSVLYSSLINGAQGTLNWCFSDFELPDIRPYSHHPHELRFGLVKTTGDLRAAAVEMKKFGEIAKALVAQDWDQVHFNNPGLVIPSNYYYDYHHDWDVEFPDWYSLYLNVFNHLKRANLHPRLLFEPAIELENNGEPTHELNINPDELPVLFLPRLKRLTAPFWGKIKNYVNTGGTVYASFAQDAWIPDWEEFFQIKSDLKFGIPAYRNWDEMEITSVHGSLDLKSEFRVPMKKESEEFAYCPVISTNGGVVFKDQSGHPVLIKIKYGDGTIYFSPYPLEMQSLYDRDGISDNFMLSLYKTIWQNRQKDGEIKFHGNDLEVGIWKHPDKRRLKVIILNHAWDRRHGHLVLPADMKIIERKNSTEYSLSAKSVIVDDLCLAD